jgi:hypothetical protein
LLGKSRRLEEREEGGGLWWLMRVVDVAVMKRVKYGKLRYIIRKLREKCQKI